MKGYEYQSDFAKKHVALGRDDGPDRGAIRRSDDGGRAPSEDSMVRWA